MNIYCQNICIRSQVIILVSDLYLLASCLINQPNADTPEPFGCNFNIRISYFRLHLVVHGGDYNYIYAVVMEEPFNTKFSR